MSENLVPLPTQATFGGRVNGIANLLGGYSGRFCVESVLQSFGLYHILEHELGHRGTADVSVTYKQYANDLVD